MSSTFHNNDSIYICNKKTIIRIAVVRQLRPIALAAFIGRFSDSDGTES